MKKYIKFGCSKEYAEKYICSSKILLRSVNTYYFVIRCENAIFIENTVYLDNNSDIPFPLEIQLKDGLIYCQTIDEEEVYEKGHFILDADDIFISTLFGRKAIKNI